MIEFKHHAGKVTGTKEINRDGVPYGIVKGYIATWDLDRGNDQFIKGCFSESIDRHKANNRPIRLMAFHRDLIGCFPIETVREDDTGLYGEAEINLSVQKGAEVYALAKQGALSDFSIGYGADDCIYDKGCRLIRKSEIWEGSLVDEPMNPKAVVTEVKTVTRRSELPSDFADQAMRWDSNAAEKRVREWADAADGPNKKYASAFMWYDAEKAGDFTAYKLQVADVVEGKLVVVPRGVFAVRAVLSGARGGVDVPEADAETVKEVVNALYEDMKLEPPFVGGKARGYHLSELKGLTASMLCDVLRKAGISGGAADEIAKAFAVERPKEKTDPKFAEEKAALDDMMNVLKSFNVRK